LRHESVPLRLWATAFTAVSADVVVIGLGAVGSATLYRLARQGIQAIGIDRFHPPHDRGSTHGESRITRLGVGEGHAYASLVRRSHEIWRELEAETGEALMLRTGGLILGPQAGGTSHHGAADFVGRSIAVATANDVPHEVLDSAEMKRRYPQLGLRGDERGYFEPSAGVVLPERAVALQLRLAAQLGATLRLGEPVLSLAETQGGVEIVTDQGRVNAGRVIMAAGAWLPGLAGLGAHAKVFRQASHWYAADNAAAYAPDRFPVMLWIHGSAEHDYIYAFPSVDGATVKAASERYSAPLDPDAVDRVVTPEESAGIHSRYVAGRLLGVGSQVVPAGTCLYTVTPDAGFLVDRMPGTSRVIVASACSGHGFKHSPALGEALAGMATADEIPESMAAFALERFAA